MVNPPQYAILSGGTICRELRSSMRLNHKVRDPSFSNVAKAIDFPSGEICAYPTLLVSERRFMVMRSKSIGGFASVEKYDQPARATMSTTAAPTKFGHTRPDLI